MSTNFLIETGRFVNNRVVSTQPHLIENRDFQWSGHGPNLTNICKWVEGPIERIASVQVKPEYANSKAGDYAFAVYRGQSPLFKYFEYTIGRRFREGRKIDPGIEISTSIHNKGYITWHYNTLNSPFFRVIRFTGENSGDFIQMGLLTDLPNKR